MWRSERDHVALVDDGDAVAEPLGLVHVMRREQHRPAARAEPEDDVPELPPRLRVQARGGLVEEEHVRIADQRAGDGEALLLPAREPFGPRCALVGQSDHLEHFVERATAQVERAEHAQVLLDGQLVRQVRLLERDAEPLTERALVALPAHPQHLDAACGGLVEAFEDLHRRRLSGAVGAEQAEALAGAHFQIEPVHGNEIAVLLHQPFTAERGRHSYLRLGRATSMRTGLSLRVFPLAATYASRASGRTRT